jgi:phage tail sheath protein FI
MPNAAKLIFNEVDLTQRIGEIAKGIVSVSVVTLRGPFGHDGEVMTSWEAFSSKYGGEKVGLAGPTLIKRMFQYGAQVRVNRVGHYTNAADPFTLDAVLATFPATIGDNDEGTPDQIFSLNVKYKGVDYNNLEAIVTSPSNGDANSFNLVIQHANEPSLTETYENLKAPGAQDIATQQAADVPWLQEIAVNSKLVEPVYVDLTGVTDLVPTAAQYDATGGSDGSAVVDADYTGDAAGGTGWYSFDGYDDFTHIASLDNNASAVIQSGSVYTAARKDCILVASLTSNNSAATIITAKQALNIDNKYAYFITGGVNHNDVLTGLAADISEIGDVLGLAAKSEADYGPWWSFAGHNRGVLENVNGVKHNFGTNGKLADLDLLANAQINSVINRKSKVMVWGNFSGQLATTIKSYIANVKLGIFIKKSLEPTLESYLEQPNDIATWAQIYDTVAPFLDDLGSADKRAIAGGEGVGWTWNGDQDAENLDSLQINTKADVLAGKYKVQLVLVETVSMQEFTINIISSNGSVTFDF